MNNPDRPKTLTELLEKIAKMPRGTPLQGLRRITAFMQGANRLKLSRGSEDRNSLTSLSGRTIEDMQNGSD